MCKGNAKPSSDSDVFQPYLTKGSSLDRKFKAKIWAGEYVELTQLVTEVSLMNLE